MEDEIFKPVIGYEGLYEVSNTGIVKALDRYNTDKNGKKKFYPGKELKYDISVRPHTSYKRVTLSKDGVTKRYLVHRLVALHFITNTDPNKNQVNHIDNNGLNNVYTNLEWVTGSGNMQHSVVQGRQFKAQSAGGTAAGANKRNKLLEHINSLLGTTVKNFTILEYLGFYTLRHWLKVKCNRCGTVSEINTQYLPRVTGKCYCCRNVKDDNLKQWLIDKNKI